ncbi:MAG: MFS transporter [Spirochaetes bacterium]|nr:MFS transporter [Spirochaetota bacterium]
MKKYGRIFYSLALANFLFFLGNSLFILLPLFLKDLGASESAIGIMNNIDKVVALFAAVFIGGLMSGRDRVRLLRLGYLILIAAFASYLLISSLTWLILLIRIVHGIGFSLAMILGTTIIFDIVSPEDAAEAIGIYGVTGALSNALSPFVGEMLLSSGYPHSLIFTLSVILVTGSLSITYMMPRLHSEEPETTGEEQRGSLRLFRNPRFAVIALVTVIFAGGFGVIITYLPNFIRTTTDMKFSYFFLIYIAVLICIRFFFIGKIGRTRSSSLLLAAFSTGTVLFFLMNSLHSYSVLALVGVLYGFTHGILYPLLNSTMVRIVSRADRGRANAIFTACFNGGMMSLALSLGFLIDRTGTYLAAFNVAGAMYIVAILMLVIMRARRARGAGAADAAL